MIHPAESTHWYTRTGMPMYTTKARAGHDRPVTLADARKLDLVPGVSAIINCAARPGLERWKAHQLLLAGLTLPRHEMESEEKWIARVYEDSQAQAKAAAERGTALHMELEQWYATNTPPQNFVLEVQAVIDAVASRYPDEKWRAEETFATAAGYGGKADLCSDRVVIDFKTKEFTEDDDPTKFAYDEHVMQGAAYLDGILPDVEGTFANVFVSTKQAGLVYIHEWSEEDIDRGYQMFMALLEYWQVKNRYRSEWV